MQMETLEELQVPTATEVSESLRGIRGPAPEEHVTP